MKPNHRKRSHVVEACALLVCLAGPVLASDDPNEELGSRLVEIRASGRTATEDPCALEAECFQLLADYDVPAQRGMIYATIASVYSERGFGPSSGKKRQQQVAKTTEYARKALEHPLDVLTACKMYGALTDAIIVGARQGPKDKWPEARRDAIIPCLKGLKLALDNKAPKDRPSPPLVTIHHVLSANDHKFAREGANQAARREQQLAARKEYERLRELHLQRRAMTERCATLYAEEPYDVEEFRAFLRKMLPSGDEAANELVQLVQARIAARRQRPQPSGSSR